MSVNSISSAAADYAANYVTAKKTEETKTESAKASATADSTAKRETQTDAANTGVVYEKSEGEQVTKKTYTPNTELVNKLKADSEARIAQMKSLVEQLLTGQGKSYAMAGDDDFWKIFSDGNLTVTEAAKKQAQEDISENGYWGVKQTSERIIDFAKALTGGDPSKIEDMRAAFEKGYKQATGTWGKELPEISSKTYDAVMAGFDNWAKESENAQ